MAGGQNKTPARGGTRPGRGYRYATAAGTPNIAQKSDEEICLHHFWFIGEGNLPYRLALGAAGAKVLVPIGLAGEQGYIASREEWPLWTETLQKLRERYALPISEWHCKGGGDTKRGSRRYILHAALFTWTTTYHTRSELAEILAEEGGTQ
jgi:hypothetical protein